MLRPIHWLCGCALVAVALHAHAVPSAATLAAYRSEDEFRAALERWRDRAAQLRGERRAHQGLFGFGAAAPAPAAAAKSEAADVRADSITNVQTAGVDEGGIVKRAGEHLVILRRGRLFTVRVGGDALQPVAAIDAYAPGSDPGGAWYDELLVSGSTVVVIGYSYARGGTEIGLFELGGDGSLAYRATYHLRSFDYYAARNYASRLVGGKLVFYTPTLLRPWGRPWEAMPGLRRWRGTAGEFERILPATRVYRTDDDFDPAEPLALHTVTACDLAAASLVCEATAVLGPAGRVFYVSQGSVYVWAASVRRAAESRAASALFRLPLDGAAPTAIKAAGVPVDQMSFLEDREGHINVLLREAGAGEGMWGSEHAAGGTALLRLPLAALGDGRAAAQREHYRRLPGSVRQNRYVGDWLLWSGDDRAAGRTVSAWAVRFASDTQPVALDPGHAVERIEALGRHALFVGNAGDDLVFTAVRLGDAAALAGRHVQPQAHQGETRSHGFFFQPAGDDDGVLGLPIIGAGGRRGIYAGAHGSAAIVYLRSSGLAFSALGRLDSHPVGPDDACKASCVDWYGNARPIFLGPRVLALLGYELVEARMTTGFGGPRIAERRRIDFGPRAARPDAVYSPFS